MNDQDSGPAPRSSAVGKARSPWKTGPFIGYIALTAVIPLAGLILCRAGIARGGKGIVQGIALFIEANLSILAYGAIFTAIIHRLYTGTK